MLSSYQNHAVPASMEKALGRDRTLEYEATSEFLHKPPLISPSALRWCTTEKEVAKYIVTLRCRGHALRIRAAVSISPSQVVKAPFNWLLRSKGSGCSCRTLTPEA